MEKCVIHLQPAEREKLSKLVRNGKIQADLVKRAYMLLHSDAGMSDVTIAQFLFCSGDTVRRARVRYLTEGLQAALQDRPHPGQAPLLNAQQEAYVIALACSEPPAGRERWTMELLAQRMIDDEQVVEISPKTVRVTLKKNKLKPWLVKEWCISEITPAFLAAMEEILTLYERPYKNSRPIVCFDEKSVELHTDVRPGLPLCRGRAKRRDYEYQRCGMRNVFLCLEPKAGKRHTLVTHRRTKEDWAKALRYLVDELYPTAERIEVVLDNLNTHTYEALIEIFGTAEADRIMRRVVLHYTPVHSSWLNMAEIERSVMVRQCTRRRLANAFTLAAELVAWEQSRNEACVMIRWKFTTKDARRVFAKYYPDPAIASC